MTTTLAWSCLPRCFVRLTMAGLFALLVVGTVPLRVSAHVALVAATPVAGATVGQSPAAVRLRLDQSPDPQFSQITLLDTMGHIVAGGAAQRDPANPNDIAVSLPKLVPGVYTVAWQALAPDGHLTKGNYSWTLAAAGAAAPAEPQPIGAANTSPNAAATTTTNAPTIAVVLVRWVRYLALGLLVGVCGLLVLIVAPVLEGYEQRAAIWGRAAGRIAPLAVSGVLIFLTAHIATLIVQSAIVANLPVTQTTPDIVRRMMNETAYGGVWRLTAIVGLLTFAALVWAIPEVRRNVRTARINIIATAPRSSRTDAFTVPAPEPALLPWRIALSGALLLVATLSLSSHAIESQHEPVLALMADAAHLGAMGLWFGGLLALLAALPLLVAALDDGDKRNTLRAAVVGRFSTLALLSVGTLIATGIYAMTLHTTRGTFLGTSYGQTLLIKHALIVPLVAVAAINLHVVRPHLRDSVQARQWLPRLLRAEAVLGVAVLLATALLTQLPPAHPLNGINAAAYDPRLAQRPYSAVDAAVDRPDADLNSGPQSAEMIHSSDVMGTLQVTTGKDGSTLGLLLFDADTVPSHEDQNGVRIGTNGAPIDPVQLPNVQRVTAVMSFTGADLGQTTVPLVRDSEGWYRAKGMFFPIKGEWHIDTVIRRFNIVNDVRLEYSFVSDPARYAAQATMPSPATQSTGVTVGNLHVPRILPNGWVGLSIALCGGGLLVLTRRRHFRAEMPERTQRIATLWSGGALVLGLVVFGYYSSDITPTTDVQNPMPNTAQTRDLGAQVFAQNCAVCHGAGGKGDGTYAAQLPVRPANLAAGHVNGHTDGDLYWWISHGVPGSGMPGFSGSLSDQEIWAAIRYVRSLDGK